MILGLLAFLSANAAAILGARAVASRFNSSAPGLDLVVFLLARLLLISAAVAAAGTLGVLGPLALGVAGLAALALAPRRGAFPAAPAWGPLARWIAAFVALRLLAQVLLFSPHVGDALAYHLPKIAEWIRAGAFTREMGLHPHANFPAGFELVEAWWVVFFRHDAMIEMAGVEFLLLAFAAVRALARAVGLDEREASWAGLLAVLSPGLSFGATSCLNDAPVAALVLAGLAAALGGAWPATSLALGLGLGVKASCVFALPGIVLLAGLTPRTRSGGWGWAALAGALGAFWYGRNLLWHGNPVHPVGTPGYAAEAVAVQAGPSLRSLAGNLIDLLGPRAADAAGPLGANLERAAGWGAALFAGGVGLAWPAGTRAWKTLLAASVLSLVGVAALTVHDAWSLKYVLFVPGILALAAVRAARFDALRWVVGAGAAFSFFATLLPYDLPRERFDLLRRSPSALCFENPPPLGEAVGAFGGHSVPSYVLYGPDYARRVAYLRSTSAEELLRDLRREGVDTLYAGAETPERRAVLDEAEARGWLRRISERWYAVVSRG